MSSLRPLLLEVARSTLAQKPSAGLTHRCSGRDDAGLRLAVLGIPFDADENAVKAYFEGFGEVESCQLMMDRGTGKSKGYAFVNMCSTEVMQSQPSQPRISLGRANLPGGWHSVLGSAPQCTLPLYPLDDETRVELHNAKPLSSRFSAYQNGVL